MSSGLAFAIPGRWTGGKREEDEMRRLMSKEAEAAKARGEILEETSASDWSSNEDENNKDQLSDPGVSIALPAPPAGATINPVTAAASKRHRDVSEILEDNVQANGDEENKQVPNILPVQAKSGSSRRLRDDTGNDADMDDTDIDDMMSLRASSRMLESINVISMDSMNVM